MPVLPLVASCAIASYELRVNALTNPLAIQGAEPVFSWKLKATDPAAKGLSQSAYRILVASNPGLLSKGKGDLWDSGKVESNETFGIRYTGQALTSRQFCVWKVQVWDQNGAPSAWSQAQSFGTGLQKPSDWDAKWIHGNKPQASPEVLDRAKWIWGDDQAGDQTPAGSHVFSHTFQVQKGAVTKLLASADDRMTVRIDGKEVLRTGGKDSWRTLNTVPLELAAGSHSIEITATNDAKSPAGLVAAIVSELGGKVSFDATDERWLADGKPAKVVGPYGTNPWGRLGPRSFVKAPAQYFFKSLSIAKKVKRATLYATALGIADFELNGKRVTEDLFSPGWTEYGKRVLYRAFDITKSLKPGKNDLQAVLGQGWYTGYVAWGAQREHYGDTPMLLMQAEIEYADGSRELIGTDRTWSVSEGEIRDEHFLHGEKYDATPTSVLATAAKEAKPKIGVLEAFNGNPVREYQRLKAQSIKAVGGQKYLIDFGQNLTGFVHLKVNYPAGTKLTIRHGERLDAKGGLYTENLRLAQAIDTYTCRGGGEEWNPRFTFHGFQYIEVDGVPTAPSKDTFTAVAISSATSESGSLETSDPMLNKLVKNAWWTQKMNFVDVPTDCPQRDERLGWTGDAQAYIRTATYYSDVQAFFDKWLVTLDDAQGADGNYPKVAPVLKGLDDGGPAWGDAGVICPMTIYQVYGDKALLARHYPQMKRFIEFCKSRSTAEMLPPKSYHLFGDWLSINADTPGDVITTAYFAGSTKIVADAARILGKSADAKELDELHQRVKLAFQKAFIDADGRVKGETQTGYVLALYFDLVPDTLVKRAADHLVENIKARDWHLSTGFVGTRDLMHVLSKIGRNDVAFRLLHNKTFPSWGFPIVNGATSIWERWDGWTPEKGFQDVGMNSFAHYAYGAVVGWMFEKIGGIKELSPGFGEILIAPVIDPNLSYSKCVYKSVRGDIKTSWRVTGGKFTLEVEVPVNTTARVVLPDGTEHRVGSGRHEFSAKI